MPSTWIVVGISVAYLAASLAVGMWPGRKASGTASGFVAGDRSLGLLVMYFITGATIFSSFAFLGGPGWAYQKGAAAFYILGYGALGLVHTHWPPDHGRFKDFIAMPKFNLYQSLHTTVLGPGRRPLEVQIRTAEMHDRAERGIAAHWRYKEGDRSAEAVASIAMLTEDYEDPQEFLAGLKIDLYQDEVFVLTPAGDVKTLPRGATPVDFAYAIHSEVGSHCAGAKVNGRLVPLRQKLRDGDTVEILEAVGGG